MNNEDTTTQGDLDRLQARYDALQQRYQHLYNTAPAGYYTVDASGTILDVNTTATRQLHTVKAQLLQTRFHRYIVETDGERFRTFFTKALALPSSVIDDVCLKPVDGNWIYVRIESRRLPEEFEKDACYRLTVSETTELHKAHDLILRREGELGLFNRVSQVMSSAQDLDQILMLLMEEVRRLLEVTACSIWLVDSETGEVVCRQAIGPHRDTILGWRLSPGQGIAGWVTSSGQSLLVNNTTADERHFDGVDRLTGEPLHSILCVPMHAQQEVIGVLQVLDTKPDRFSETDQTLQELLATIASIAIENARLHEHVQQDNVTKRLLLSDLNSRITMLLTRNIRFLSTARRYARLKRQPETQAFLTTMLTRMQGLKRVYAFLAEFEWNPLPLSELIHRVIQGTLDALASDKRVSVDIAASPVRVTADQADSFGLIMNELVMNTVKHATADRKTANIIVHIGRIGESIYVQYRDDGPGWPPDVMRFDQHQSGVYLLQKIVRKNLDGKLDLYNEDGAVAEIRCKRLVQNVV